jgi:hypothetical protein
MTRDDIIKLMQQACDPDKKPAWHNGFWTITQLWTITQEELERFAALVAAAKLEPLTDEEIGDAYYKWDKTPGASMADFARAIESAHGIGEKR